MSIDREERNLELVESYKLGCGYALESLITNNMPLINEICNNYSIFDSSEKVSIGYEALVMVLKTFNPDKGSFYFYYKFYLKNSVKKRLNSRCIVKLKRGKTTDFQKTFNYNPIYLDDIEKDIYGMIDNTVEEKDYIRELTPMMYECMAKLPFKHQCMLIHKYVYNLKYRELEHIYGVSFQRIQQIIKLSISRINKMMEKDIEKY